MTSDRGGDPWRGDVRLGVEAWTGAPRETPGSSAPPGPPPPPEDEAAEGPDADAESVARTILLDQLAGRARSRRELGDKLRQRQVPDEIATRLLDRFEEVGLVDDAAFAHAWVSGRHTAKGLAPRALAQELRRKGVDDEVAREALDQVDDDLQEATARSLVRRKLRSLARFDQDVQTRRLVGMLARKGYSPGLAFRVVRDEVRGTADTSDLEP
jgi:regulatory protein